MSKRAVFYVDGFNLYHAIDRIGKPHLKWFSLQDYAAFITAREGETLEGVQYFSALAHHYPLSVPRHQAYIRALKRTGIVCTLGKFKKKPRQCKKCQQQQQQQQH